MSNSDLVTTALGTGGTSFDTATCIGGYKNDPFITVGGSGLVYHHDMIQTKTKYTSIGLNTTMETYDATTAPNGTKPTRSPFADDANAYFVGDTNFQDAGNGLVRFKRTFSKIPSDYEIPYGLYTRVMPAITAHSASTALTTSNFDLANSFVGIAVTTSTSNAESEDFYINNIDSSSVVKEKKTLTEISNGITYSNEIGDNFNYVSNSTITRLVIKVKYASGFSGDLKNDIAEGLTVSLGSTCRLVYKQGTNNPSDFRITIFAFTSLKIVDYDNDGFIGIATSPSYTLGNNRDNGYMGNKLCWGNYSTYNPNNPNDRSLRAFGQSGISNLDSSGGNSRTTAQELLMPAKISYRYIKADSIDGIQFNDKVDLPLSVDANSSPTRTEFQAQVASNEFFPAEPEFLEKYLGNIYAIGQIKTQYK